MKLSLDRLNLYDGSKGALLQSTGLRGDEASDLWNVEHADAVFSVHRAYVEAGCDAIQTNTFTGNPIQLARHGLAGRTAELNEKAVALACAEAGNASVIASVGPTGELFAPMGGLTFERAYSAFSEQIKALFGVDAVHFETFGDIAEIRTGILAARENSVAPVIVTATFEAGGRTLSGNSPEVVAIVASSLGAIAVGANCSGGPSSLLAPIQAMSKVVNIPLVAKPNAGLPQLVDGKTVFSLNADQFSSLTSDFVAAGVRLIGGCCGTTPDYMRSLGKKLAALSPAPERNNGEFICSAFEFLPADDLSFDCFALSDEMLSGDGAYDALDEADELDTDAIGIDLSNVTDASDAEEFLSEFCIQCKSPLVFVAEDGQDEILEKMLRHYAGRAAVKIPASLVPVAEKYGAYIL